MPGSISIPTPVRPRNTTTGTQSGSPSRAAPANSTSVSKNFLRAGMLTKIESIFPRAKFKKINIIQPSLPSTTGKISNT